MFNRTSWADNAIFYHIYPLGLCGAPLENDFSGAPVNRLEQLRDWIPHIKNLGCNALYIGPVFESDFHGYDTADYLLADRRLGTNETLKSLIADFQQSGIRVVLDTVFNHTGRNFAPFTDLKENGSLSKYKEWFCGVDFSRDSTYGDGFYYDGWYDAYNLVKLNLGNAEVRDYLFAVVKLWIDWFNIDGLRLDVAEIMDKQFLKELSTYCRNYKDDFWLLGEVITGKYSLWVNEEMLDSATNYQAYKGLYSSHNDRNYYEIAHTLERQFGVEGIYRDLLLYNFADNHDVTRLASILNDTAHYFPLYTLLFTMPGIPSVYYGSEWGQQGIKGQHQDTELRPAISEVKPCNLSDICVLIQKLASIRHRYIALQKGAYRQLYISHHCFVFCRETEGQVVYVALNSSGSPTDVTIQINQDEVNYHDGLDPAYLITGKWGDLQIQIPANGARIMTPQHYDE